MKKLDIPKKDFYAYARWVQGARRYKRNWAFVIFKANYGDWVDRATRFDDDGFEVLPQRPTEEFYTWLNDYIDEFIFDEYMKEHGKDWEARRKAVLAKLRKTT